MSERTPEQILATGAAWVTETELERSVTELTRVRADRDRMPVLFGDRDCVTCGKPHNAYPREGNMAPSWADPVDGHPYRPKPWKDVAKDAQSELLRLREREQELETALQAMSAVARRSG